MVEDVSKVLAGEIVEGNYVPSLIDSCDVTVPIDKNVHSVRFTQFLLLTKSKKQIDIAKPPRYLTVEKHHVAKISREDDEQTSQEIRQIAEGLVSSFPSFRSFLNGDLPNPKNKKSQNIEKMRKLLSKNLEKVYRADLSDEEVKNTYEKWLLDQLRKDASALISTVGCVKGMPYENHVTAPKFLKNPHAILDWVKETVEILLRGLVFSPEEAPLKSPHPHFALCATYEQLWEPKGYTRGELLNSFSLAPGEQLTLEFHSWDKSTSKRETELASESELRISSKLTTRDNQQIITELATEMGAKLNGEGGIDIPIPAGDIPLPVSLGASADIAGKINADVKTTIDRTIERTLDASRVLKNNRRIRVEVAREIGREEKQTRIIVNTNRCHTLNAHYFEVMANYLVRTHLISLKPCILIPCPEINLGDGKKARPWVLSHEDSLKEALLDEIFTPGFQAAKLLEAVQIYEGFKNQTLAKEEGDGATSTNSIEEEFCRHRTSITEAYGKLQDAKEVVFEAINDPDSEKALELTGSIGFIAVVVAKVVSKKGDVMPLRRFLYLALLQATPYAINAIDGLRNKSSEMPCREAIRNFFAAIQPKDFQFNLIASSVSKGLVALGVPEEIADVVSRGFIDYLDDDAGLYLAVNAAYDRHKILNEGPIAEVTSEVSGTTTTLEPAKEGYSLIERAEAEVEYQRLIDHLLDQKEHYQQAIWLKTHPDARLRYLEEQGAVASIMSDEVLGFYADKVAYPVANLPLLDKKFSIFGDVPDKVCTTLENIPQEPRLVTLPTHGTVLEMALGACDGCEDYIQQSRLIELREREAKARQEEAEANRRQQRLESTPPDLSEFRSIPTGKLTVNLEANTTNNQ